MATLGSLIISLEANTAKFESAMTKAEYAAKKSSDAIKGAFIGLGTALAAAFSVHEMVSAIEAVAKYEGQLLKMAGRLNTSVETLSSFGVMMRKTGMDTEAFYTTLTRLEKGISAAAKKGEEGKEIIDEEGNVVLKTAKAYDELGLKAEILNKLPLDQQLMAIAEAFKRNIDPADRVRVAMEIGGKSAAGLVNIFKGGAADIEKWINQQREIGIVTEEAAKKATEFNNAIADLTAQWEAFKRNLAEGVIPTLIELLKAINDVIKAWREFRESHVGQYAPTIPPKGPTVRRIEPEQAVGVPQMGPMGLQLPPVTPLPPGVFKTPIRTGTTAGKGGGGAGDMGLDRMRSIIDTLQKDISRLTEGSLAEIREWANHLRNEIEKVGRKGADTTEALTLVNKAEKLKMDKADEDYYLSVARETGDSYKVIDAEMKDWLTRYKGQLDAQENYNKIKNRKIAAEDNRQMTEKLGLQASLMNSIATEAPTLSQNLAIKEKLLPLENEIARLTLERAMASLKLTHAQKDELRSLLGVAAAAKKYSLERAKWAREGLTGGLKIGAEQLKKTADTFAADTTARFVESLPREVSELMASSFIGFIQGKAPDLQAIGISMTQSIIQTLLEGILNQVLPAFIEGLAGGLGSILGDIMGGGGGILSILGLHQGGLIEAHSGWPLRYDERIIKVQTGERVLSRSQNRAYESGINSGGGGGGETINIYPRYPMSRQETEYIVRTRLIPALAKEKKRAGGRYL